MYETIQRNGGYVRLGPSGTNFVSIAISNETSTPCIQNFFIGPGSSNRSKQPTLKPIEKILPEMDRNFRIQRRS